MTKKTQAIISFVFSAFALHTLVSCNLPSSNTIPEKTALLPIKSNGNPSTLISQGVPIVPAWNKVNGKSQFPTLRLPRDKNTGIAYKPDKKPVFKTSFKLNEVLKKILELIKKEKLSEENLSITLIDASTGEIAEFGSGKIIFPASIAKIFWLTALEGQIEANMWNSPELFDPYINRMMKESDNDSSSFIIDNITGSFSSEQTFSENEVASWLSQRRLRINNYFTSSEYNENMNLTQKTYPIPYLNLSEPKGNELQIRHSSQRPNQLIRNGLTTFDTARLMYEICYKKEAVSRKTSEKMCPLLKRDVDKSQWSKIKQEDFNPVQSFLGESLPSKNVRFYSKAGWTPKSRSEVSLVEILDKKKTYVISIFADNPSMGGSKTIFPDISKLVYNEMHGSN